MRPMLPVRSALGVLIALAAFELLLRNLQFGHPILDPQLGWEWRSVTVVHRLTEGFGVSHWLADSTRAHAPVAGAPRVLVLGDSFTEALQVDDDEVFTGRLHAIDALNAGRSSHSPAEYVAFAGAYHGRYRQAWTIVEVGPADFSDDAFQPDKTHFDEHLNVVVIPPHFGRISAVLMRFRDRSALLDYGIARWQAYRSAAKMPPLFHAADTAMPVEPAATRPQRVWPVAGEMELLRRAYDSRLTFLFIPPFDDSPSPMERQFDAACAANAFSCVNARVSFAGFRRRGDAPTGFPNSRFAGGHLNARGHAAVARLLDIEMERLRARGLF